MDNNQQEPTIINAQKPTQFTKYIDTRPKHKSFDPQAHIKIPDQVTPPKKPSKKIFKVLAFIGNFIWISFIVLMVVKLVGFQHVQVDGRSSYPNYDTGEYLLMNNLDKKLDRGQVVAVYSIRNFAYRVNFEMNPVEAFFSRFDCPSSSDCPAKFYLKRVVGLPGECIEIKNYKSVIYKDSNDNQGQYLKEDYINTSENRGSRQDLAKVCMESDEYFLMGDNRGNSNDSRELGKFKNYQIFGKEFVKFQPISKFRFFVLPKFEFLPTSSLTNLTATESSNKNSTVNINR
jgi:signal peptidase I